MVKVPSGRKNIEGSFGEDIGIVSILGGKDNVVLLSGDSEFSGQGSFLNVFVIEQDSFLYPVNAGVVLHQPRHS